MNVSVYAIHKGVRCNCQAQKSKRYDVVWRCGNCERGVVAVGDGAAITPNSACRVCGAEVEIVKCPPSGLFFSPEVRS